VSLDDWKPEYLRIRTESPALWSSSQVDNAWCEQFEFEPSSAASDMCRAAALPLGSNGATTRPLVSGGVVQKREIIIIDGISVTVGKNLAAALACLRGTDVYKIWLMLSVHILIDPESNTSET
jgi:hypothetical protein